MRLYLLPLSRRRAFLYCQTVSNPTEKKSIVDKVTTKAAKTWLGWEKAEGGWKLSVTKYGNKLLERIAYEEWSLKTIPALPAPQKRTDAKVEVQFPKKLYDDKIAASILSKFATERQGLHRQRMIGSIIVMPFTLPVAIIPIVPNLPFFYLVFRAWSHYRALNGSRHLEHLCNQNQLSYNPSSIIAEVYNKSKAYKLPFTADIDVRDQDRTEGNIKALAEEPCVLDLEDAKELAEKLECPELGPELERAIKQVDLAHKQGQAEQKQLKEREEQQKLSPPPQEQPPK